MCCVEFRAQISLHWFNYAWGVAQTFKSPLFIGSFMCREQSKFWGCLNVAVILFPNFMGGAYFLQFSCWDITAVLSVVSVLSGRPPAILLLDALASSAIAGSCSRLERLLAAALAWIDIAGSCSRKFLVLQASLRSLLLSRRSVSQRFLFILCLALCVSLGSFLYALEPSSLALCCWLSLF